MSRESEQRITEWVLWFHEHRGYVERNPDPEKSKEFLIKAVDGAFECIALALTDIQNLENRRKAGDVPAHGQILLPRIHQFR